MAINKPQKKHWKKAKKGSRKKYQDPQLRKEWYYVRAPAPFEKNTIGMTCVNRK
jgi:small subunit ribosomal protein S3Ae